MPPAGSGAPPPTAHALRFRNTKSGNVRFVLRDDEGREYATFREEIARTALAAERRRARVHFHEEQRARFTNVYLNGVEIVEAEHAPASEA